MIIELNPALVFEEVSFPAPALEVYIEISSFGAQENVQVSDNEDASTEKAVRFDKPTGPSITSEPEGISLKMLVENPDNLSRK